jgi:hypothetical protein
MNKIHRTVWSESRQAYVVAHEGAAARGKSSTTRKAAVVTAVAAALAALSMDASAVSSCGVAGTTLVSAAETSTCSLVTGESLSVTGSIVLPALTGVIANNVLVGSIRNNGLISSAGTDVVYFNNSTVGAGITNSGTISNLGSRDTLYLNNSTISGGIINSGTISSGHHGIHMNSGANLIDSIQNLPGGLIQTADTGILLSTGAVSGGVTNSGRIVSTGGIALKASLATAFTNNPGGTVVGQISRNFNVTNNGLWALQLGSTLGGAVAGSQVSSSISGNYVQGSTGALQVGVAGPASGQFSTLTVGGSVTLPASAQFNVAAGTAATCDGITVGTTLTGVITSTGPVSAGGGYTVTDNCTGVDFIVQASTNRIDLVAITAAPVTAQSIPTLSEWGLIALSGLLGLFGWRQMRRRDPHNRLV